MASYFRCNLSEEESNAAFTEFDGWLDPDEVRQIEPLFDHYLFYETYGRKDYRECYCGRCGSFVRYKGEDPDFFTSHHRDLVECPDCGEDVELISLGKMRSFESLKQSIKVTICREGKNGALLLTSGVVRKDYSDCEMNPYPELEETRRTYLAPGKRMQWTPRWRWIDGHAVQDGWERETSVREPFSPNMSHTYDGSYYLITPDQIENTDHRYCQIWDYYRDRFGQEIWFPEMAVDATRYSVKYLAAYTALPSMEIAVRINFGEAVQELVEYGRKNADVINWSGRNPAEFLRLSKQDSKTLLHQGVNLATLRFYKEERKASRVKNMAEFLIIVDMVGGVKNLQLLKQIIGIVGCSMNQGAKYAQKHDDGHPRRTLTMWRDYLRFGQRLGYDMTRMDVLMPKNLRERHDAAAATIKHEDDAKAMEQYRKRYAQLCRMYEFSYGGYCIVVPARAADIVSEGQTLKHCVAGYADRHLKGTVDILFFRKERKKHRSFVTIEMGPRKATADRVNVRQVHGYRNDLYKNAVRPMDRYEWFFSVWLDWLRHGSKRDKNGRPILPETKENTA